MVQVHHRHSFYTLLLACVCSVSAQDVVNGQIFTNGLAIVNAPAVRSDQHAGSDLVISIDVSGNGRIPEAARVPGSNAETRFDALQLYFVSSSSQQNFTVSEGPGLLTQEPGSTVKHLNWPIPRCATPGSFNLSVYENSHINGGGYFAITSIPVQLLNTNPTDQCDSSVTTNEFRSGGGFSPVATNPFTGNPNQSGEPSESGQASPKSPSDPIKISSAPPSPSPQVVEDLPSDRRTTVTLVYAQTTVVTESGTTYTTTTLTTVTALRTATSNDPSSFIPINGAVAVLIPSMVVSFIAIGASMLFMRC